jgi:hypothetical protein
MSPELKSNVPAVSQEIVGRVVSLYDFSWSNVQEENESKLVVVAIVSRSYQESSSSVLGLVREVVDL